MITLLMFSWFPVVVYLFMRFPPQRALIISFIAAWLFLPQAVIKLPAIPVEYNRMSATSLGVLFATCFYDIERFKSFKFHWFDLPIIVWCLCPLASSITNDLGLYDGLSSTIRQTMTWGAPYFLGRIYLNNFAGMRQLAMGVFWGGLLYAPLCLFEAAARTNLHGLIYRFQLGSQSDGFANRLGGYRPTVFLEHGLALATWMMFVTLMGVVLWRTKAIKQVQSIPISWFIALLIITFILLRSTGAYFLLFVALTIMLLAQQYGTSFLVWLLLGGLCIYLYLGAVGLFPGQQIIDFLENFIDPDRLQSLGFRFMNEELLSAKAREQMLFGWGGYGRNLVYKDDGYASTVTDSLWIIAFGQNGLVGLVSVFSALLLPVLSFWSAYPPSSWSHSNVVITAAIAVGLALYTLDSVINAMFDPIFILAGGGLTGTILNQQRQRLLTRPAAVRSVR